MTEDRKTASTAARLRLQALETAARSAAYLVTLIDGGVRGERQNRKLSEVTRDAVNVLRDELEALGVLQEVERELSEERP
jgi:hypothetical protein